MNRSKHVDPDGTLRYDATGEQVFPGPTGVPSHADASAVAAYQFRMVYGRSPTPSELKAYMNGRLNG